MKKIFIAAVIALSIFVGVVIGSCAPVAGTSAGGGGRGMAEVLILSDEPFVVRVWDTQFQTVCYIYGSQLECK